MRPGCAKGHQKAQSGQRVERMAWGYAEGDSVPRRGPRAVSIGMDALARQLRRALRDSLIYSLASYTWASKAGVERVDAIEAADAGTEWL
jgi:hypothetical protein